MKLTNAVLEYIKEHEQEALELLMELAVIPAPSHHEERRAAFCKQWLERQGAQGVYIDEALNVVWPIGCTEDIDLAPYGEDLKHITSAKKTASGNFILEVKGPGYGIKGGDEYHPASGEYIIVRVSMTPEGRIIDTFTVSQEESKGIGDACADEKFYGQFDGKTESDYKDIDAIAGATMTTDGYLTAIERAFAALNVLKGGSN